MKVLLDTNVLIGALATRGLCADVLREVLVSHQLVISTPLLEELKRVLEQKLKVPDGLIVEFIELIQRDAQLSTPSDLPDVKIQDKDDLIILSSAVNGRADLFVTGDRELLVLQNVGSMEIVSPRRVGEKLKAQPPDKVGP